MDISNKTKLVIASLGVGAVVFAGVIAYPKGEVLDIPTEKIINSESFIEREYDDNKVLISQKEITAFRYVSDEDAPFLKNEVQDKRTTSTVTIALGDNRFVAKTGHLSTKENGVWKKIKTATTTPEIFERSTKPLISRLIDTAFGASTGLTVGGTATDEGGGTGCGPTWQNVNNILVDDTAYASNAGDLCEDDLSNYIHAENFGFAIDSGATVDGIEMRTRVSEVNSDDAKDNTLQLVVGGTRTGDNKSAGASWTSILTYRTVGSSIDTWAISPTPAIVNAVDFGAAFRFECVERSDCADGNERLYSIELNIYYTAGGVTPVQAEVIIKSGTIKIKSEEFIIK